MEQATRIDSFPMCVGFAIRVVQSPKLVQQHAQYVDNIRPKWRVVALGFCSDAQDCPFAQNTFSQFKTHSFHISVFVVFAVFCPLCIFFWLYHWGPDLSFRNWFRLRDWISTAFLTSWRRFLSCLFSGHFAWRFVGLSLHVWGSKNKHMRVRKLTGNNCPPKLELCWL